VAVHNEKVRGTRRKQGFDSPRGYMPDRRNTTKSTAAVAEEISWSAAEHGYYEKDLRWYLAVGGVGAVLFILALWQSNYFFAVFVAFAAGVLIHFGKRRPKVLDFRITKEGVGIGERFLEFDRLESFAVRERPGALHELIVKQRVYMNPYVRIPIDGMTAKRAQEFLAERLPEEEYQQSFIDLFADWLGF